ncbi:hypothetical protein [Streptomyces sp. NPDC086182]|uniref:hypothetical protein n=1 Tax=Streptomyces sp. NPDC086182 TaxID=3155058 RepID=UPI003430E037
MADVLLEDIAGIAQQKRPPFLAMTLKLKRVHALLIDQDYNITGNTLALLCLHLFCTDLVESTTSRGDLLRVDPATL